jgi:hypothetical protein
VQVVCGVGRGLGTLLVGGSEVPAGLEDEGGGADVGLADVGALDAGATVGVSVGLGASTGVVGTDDAATVGRPACA